MKTNSSYLIHYASEYYDPVKAHEYYMRNRELKGRRKGQLNDSGKAAKEYVKGRIEEEKKSKLDEVQINKSSQIEQAQKQRKDQIDSHTNSMNLKIKSLREQIENMSSAELKNQKVRIQKEIDDLRNDNARKKEELNIAYKSQSESIRENSRQQSEQIRSDAKTKYNDELDKIYADKNMVKAQSGSKTSSNVTGYDPVTRKARKK